MVGCSRFGLTALLFVCAAAVSPVEKVLQLMGNLQKTLEDEGKTDAAEYDKFACWCKKEADERQYSLEKSAKKQASLNANIEKLTNEIAELDNRNKELNGELDTLRDFVSDMEKKRKEENDQYRADKQDFETCIDHTKQAKAALKTDAKAPEHLALVQEVTRKYASAFVQVKAHAPDGYVHDERDALGEIIDRVNDDCEKQHKENEDTEFNAKTQFDMKRQAKNFEIKTASEELRENEALAEQKTQEKDEANAHLEEEKESEAADKAFLYEGDGGLVAQCESKAKQFDTRSDERNTELTNLAKAKDLIETGAKPNYGANKKLVLLQVAESSAAVERARKLLMSSAKRLKSTTLASVAMKVRFQGGFGKVRKLIADMVEKLEDEQAADDKKSSKCGEDFTREANNRDDAQLEIERHTATISKTTSSINSLNANIRDLTNEIAELQTALAENTQMTTTTKANLNKQKTEAEEGNDAVEAAISVLGGSGGYQGNAQGGAILGMLQVICDDFKRTIRTTEENLGELEGDFETFSTDTENTIKEKTDLKEKAESDLAADTTKLEQANKDKSSNQDILDDAMEAIEALKPLCTGGESYEDRVRERKEEIQSLKDAYTILDGM